MSAMIPRQVRPFVLEALEDTRIVVVQGARQVGKTTLLRDIIAEKGGRLVTLDDPATRSSAMADPVGFLNQHADGLLGVDEVQLVPELIRALKLVVDRDPRPGRFLITGSADLLRLPAADDSLAGRAESVDLHGFSQGELTTHRERFIDRLLAGDSFMGHTSSLTRHDYLERAIAGTYPDALARPAGRRRNRWIDGYLTRIVERDAPEVSSIQRIDELPRILRVLAARNSDELNVSSVAAATGVPATSLQRMVELLETLFLIQRIPAWSTNLSKRVISRPKVCLLDTGLAARLINVSADGADPSTNPDIAGKLLEGFVAGELRRQLGWAETPVRIGHYRDRSGAEVDLVIETPDGRVAGIEVKSTSSPGARDARWLVRLRDTLGARFVGGLILYTGTDTHAFGDRIAITPISTLWTA